MADERIYEVVQGTAGPITGTDVPTMSADTACLSVTNQNALLIWPVKQKPAIWSYMRHHMEELSNAQEAGEADALVREWWNEGDIAKRFLAALHLKTGGAVAKVNTEVRLRHPTGISSFVVYAAHAESEAALQQAAQEALDRHAGLGNVKPTPTFEAVKAAPQ